MALFNRSKKTAEVALTPPAAFWTWWVAQGAERAAASISSRVWGGLPQEMTRRVHAIHPDLQWEFSAGDRAEHVLCVTAAGVPELRATAARWRRAAPAESETWQYEPARRRDASVSDAHLQIGGRTLSLGHTTVTAQLDEHRLRFDVTLHHPEFAQMGEKDRLQFAFLVLDWTLGEDDVERWVGAVETTGEPDPARVGLSEFLADVDAAAARPVEKTWAMLAGDGPDGLPVMALARRPLRWIDSPLLDQHNMVTLTFSPQSNGLPADRELDWLREQEEDLTRAAGPGAELLALETQNGRRLLHLYSDSEDQNVTARIRGWVEAAGRASLDVELDPSWRAVRHLG